MDLNNHRAVLKFREAYAKLCNNGDITDKEFSERYQLRKVTIDKLLFAPNDEKPYLENQHVIKLHHYFGIPYEDLISYDAYWKYINNKTPVQRRDELEMYKQYEKGKNWEEMVIDYYNERGYFTYKMPTMSKGTVFDIMAVKKGAALMIECKHIQGEKLYYKGSGLIKKRDEIENFIKRTGNNLYIYVMSEATGTWWTTWVQARELLEKRGYITKEDCIKCDLSQYARPETRPEQNEKLFKEFVEKKRKEEEDIECGEEFEVGDDERC